MTKVVLNVPERTAERLQSATPMELETVSMVMLTTGFWRSPLTAKPMCL